MASHLKRGEVAASVFHGLVRKNLYSSDTINPSFTTNQRRLMHPMQYKTKICHDCTSIKFASKECITISPREQDTSLLLLVSPIWVVPCCIQNTMQAFQICCWHPLELITNHSLQGCFSRHSITIRSAPDRQYTCATKPYWHSTKPVLTMCSFCVDSLFLF